MKFHWILFDRMSIVGWDRFLWPYQHRVIAQQPNPDWVKYSNFYNCLRSVIETEISSFQRNFCRHFNEIFTTCQIGSCQFKKFFWSHPDSKYHRVKVSKSIIHQSETFTSDRCLIDVDVDPRAFVIWELAKILSIWRLFRFDEWSSRGE